MGADKTRGFESGSDQRVLRHVSSSRSAGGTALHTVQLFVAGDVQLTSACHSANAAERRSR
ncbi:hypothetical protein ASE95_10440 [Sphingomonas sp. Leaf231]|nr:hypothetical protein ASE95_10440 [Sphingomonas sp. Leaf231]